MSGVKQSGQSTVEYILLLSVVMLFIALVLRSPLFADLLGENSSFFQALKDRMEYSYRYTHLGTRSGSGDENITDPKLHDSYSDDGSSRFSGATEPYGGGN